MWIANIVGPLRGESTDIDKPGIWSFDPHAVVSSFNVELG